MGLFLPVLPLTLQVSEQMPEPTLGVGKHWGFSEENGANKLKLIMSLKDRSVRRNTHSLMPIYLQLSADTFESSQLLTSYGLEEGFSLKEKCLANSRYS